LPAPPSQPHDPFPRLLSEGLEGPERAELTVAERALALGLALGAVGRFDELRALHAAARERGVDARLLREGALMTHLFGGFPRAIEAFAALGDAPDAAAAPAADRRDEAERARAGAALFGRVYGGNAERVRVQLRAAAPDLERAVLEDAYGRILSRGALDARTRELMAVCALAVLDLPRQLRSHIRGALACGASLRAVTESITLATALGAEAGAATAKRILDEERT
jgi:4-carboxymuconolactone decarboxylase